MKEPITVSPEAYQRIEEWMEEVYNTYGFKRIIKNGEPLGYEGFIKNFELRCEIIEGDSVEVLLVAREANVVRHRKVFKRY